MVKIKTKSEANNKVTLADLNANILNLTAALKGNSEIMKAATKNIINSLPSKNSASSGSSSSSSSGYNNSNKSLAKEIVEAIYSGEVRKQSSNVGSTFLGGVTGISPVLIQKLNIDKAIGAALKHSWNTAKAKAQSSKVNSAVDENRKAGTNKRLDTIIGLIKGNKKAQILDDKKQEGRFGQFLRTLGLFLGPLLKLAGTATAIASILRAVNWLAQKAGFKPDEVAPAITGAGYGLRNNAKIRSNTLKNEKLYRDALKDYMEDPYFKKMTPQERVKAQYGEILKDAPKEYRQKLERLKSTRVNLQETSGATSTAIKNAELNAARSAKNLTNGKITPKVTEPIKYGTKNLGAKTEAFLGKNMNRAANIIIAADTASNVIDDIKDKNYGKAGADVLRGGGIWGGMAAGGRLGAMVPGPWYVKLAGGVVGAGGGAVLGEKGIEALFPQYYNQLTLEKLADVDPKHVKNPYGLISSNSQYYLDKYIEDDINNNYGKVPKWRDNWLGHTTHGFLTQILGKYMPGSGYYYDWAKGNPTWTYGITNTDLDPEWRAYVYAQGKAGRAMPKIPKSAYQGERGYLHAKSPIGRDFDYIYEQGLKAREKEYGLTTDFTQPIQAADQAEKPATELIETTKSTNEILQDILNAIQDNNNSNRGLFSSINNKLNNSSTSVSNNEVATEELNGLPSLSYLTNHGRIMGYGKSSL